MDIASLQAFLAVADSGSFSLAGAQLHLSQPAVSKRIATLETTLDVRLFDRIGRQVLLTEAGQTLLPRARSIVAELADCRRALSKLAGQVSGALTIATSHHIGLHRLPTVLRTFAAHFPQVQLELRFTDSELACTQVVRGEVELGIVTLPPQPQEPLQCISIWPDPLAVLVNPTHPLAQIEIVTAKLLSQYPAILPGEITFTRRIVDKFFQTQAVEPQIAFATNYLETIKMMVAVGLGWSVLPRTMIDDDVHELAVTGWSEERTLGVVMHSHHTRSNAAQALLDLLQSKAVHRG